MGNNRDILSLKPNKSIEFSDVNHVHMKKKIILKLFD